MKKIALIFSIAFLTVTTAANADIHRHFRKVPNRYIVEAAEKNREAIRQLAAEAGVRFAGSRVIRVFDEVLGGFEIEATEQHAMALSNLPGVVGVHEVPIGQLTTIANANSWGRDRVDQTALPLDGLYNYYWTGSNVTLYVVDSGVNAVGELAGRVAQRLDWSGTGLNDCVAPNGHGTQVASTAGGATYGIAREMRIVSLKVVDCAGDGPAGNLIAALNWIVQNRPAGELSVANISLLYPADTNIDQAVRDAVQAGVTVVIGAGNNGLDACNFSPARTGNPAFIVNNPNGFSAITVAASDPGDRVAWWASGLSSNTGQCIDVFAPGGPGLTAQGTNAIASDWAGTSAASPHVAGMAALTLQRYGAIDPGMVENHLLQIATPNVITNNPNGLANLRTGTPNRLLYHVITARRRACCS